MLIVFDGVDSSGKATQTERVYNKLKNDGKNVRKISFPNYEGESSALVKMYLEGAFGQNASDVSPYAASLFYAVDRYASYRTDWSAFLEEGGILIADRYVTSNMIHQAAKIENQSEKDAFLDWLYDIEYNKMGLPVPDKTIFLDMPPSFAERLMRERKNKITGEAEKDIHERDKHHIIKAYNNAIYVAEKYGWNRVSCVKDEKVREIADITSEITGILGI